MNYEIVTLDGFSHIPSPELLSVDSTILIIIKVLNNDDFSTLCECLSKYSNKVWHLELDFDAELGLDEIEHFCLALEKSCILEGLSLIFNARMKNDECLSKVWEILVHCKKLTGLAISFNSENVSCISFNALVKNLPLYPILDVIDFHDTFLYLTDEQQLELKVALRNCSYLNYTDGRLYPGKEEEMENSIEAWVSQEEYKQASSSSSSPPQNSILLSNINGAVYPGEGAVYGKPYPAEQKH